MTAITYAVLVPGEEPVLETRELVPKWDDFVGTIGYPMALVVARSEGLAPASLLIALESPFATTRPEVNRLASTLAGSEVRGPAVLVGPQNQNQSLTSLSEEWVTKVGRIVAASSQPEPSQ